MSPASLLKTYWRELTIGVLTVLLGVLIVARFNAPAPWRGPSPEKVSIGEDGRIDSAIHVVLERFGLTLPAGRAARGMQGQGDGIRQEFRIRVSPDFPSLVFNHALGEALRPLGARVIGTENTQDKRVDLHIRKDGIILRTLIFMESTDQ